MRHEYYREAPMVVSWEEYGPLDGGLGGDSSDKETHLTG